MQGKTKVVGYCRVSTENQKDAGNIQIQERAIREFCISKGFELVDTFKDEAVSGKT